MTATAKPNTTAAKVRKTRSVASIPLSTAFTPDMYGKIEAFRKRNGLPHPQDVVRLAVAAYLNKVGE